ncbi:MAG: hypothetical protein AAFY71_11850 [Bacteroidota bacterium]
MSRLILSRKGFDSSSGGCASPLIGDELLSLPIPQAKTGISYSNLMWKGKSYSKWMKGLTSKELGDCHLDPDLMNEQIPARDNWKAAFGQHGSSLTHLQSEGVGVGDIFLFFGWFKEARLENDQWVFVKGAPNLHIIFGYLEIGEIIDLSVQAAPTFLSHHPHVKAKDSFKRGGNQIFVAADRLSINKELPAWGTFTFKETLCLTGIEGKRSKWILPACFFDKRGNCKLSYHRKFKGEKLVGRDQYLLQSVPRGQEFVTEVDEEMETWLRSIF